MNIYDVLKKEYEDANAEEKLAVLRLEMRMPIEKIRGYANILKKEYGSMTTESLSSDFEDCIDEIATAGDTLKAVLDALTT